jgi:phage baseplate assembly protein W
MATITRKYTDLDAMFASNLVTRDISVRSDVNAIKFAIKSLVLTRNFERPFQSSIGSQAHKLLFEPMDDVTKIVLSRAIMQSIVNHEPRVDIDTVKITMNQDTLVGIISISFVIKNTTIPLSINVALERSR